MEKALLLEKKRKEQEDRRRKQEELDKILLENRRKVCRACSCIVLQWWSCLGVFVADLQCMYVS